MMKIVIPKVRGTDVRVRFILRAVSVRRVILNNMIEIFSRFSTRVLNLFAREFRMSEGGYMIGI